MIHYWNKKGAYGHVVYPACVNGLGEKVIKWTRAEPLVELQLAPALARADPTQEFWIPLDQKSLDPTQACASCIEHKWAHGYSMVHGGETYHERLQRYLSKQGPTWVAMLREFVSLVRALSKLHTTANIVHRDIKSVNLVWKEPGQLRLVDFGLSQLVRVSDKNLPTTNLPNKSSSTNPSNKSSSTNFASINMTSTSLANINTTGTSLTSNNSTKSMSTTQDLSAPVSSVLNNPSGSISKPSVSSPIPILKPYALWPPELNFTATKMRYATPKEWIEWVLLAEVNEWASWEHYYPHPPDCHAATFFSEKDKKSLPFAADAYMAGSMCLHFVNHSYLPWIRNPPFHDTLLNWKRLVLIPLVHPFAEQRLTLLEAEHHTLALLNGLHQSHDLAMSPKFSSWNQSSSFSSSFSSSSTSSFVSHEASSSSSSSVSTSRSRSRYQRLHQQKKAAKYIQQMGLL